MGEKKTNLEKIKASFLTDNLTQAYETSPFVLYCDSLICKNSSDLLGLNEQSEQSMNNQCVVIPG